MIVFLAVVIIEMIFIYDAAFYRTVFLIIAAHATGSSLSVFGAVPKYWPWIIALFSALVFAASLAGAATNGKSPDFDFGVRGSSPRAPISAAKRQNRESLIGAR